MNYTNLDEMEAYKALLAADKASVKTLLSPERIKSANVKIGGGMNYNWAAMPIDDKILTPAEACRRDAACRQVQGNPVRQDDEPR